MAAYEIEPDEKPDYIRTGGGLIELERVKIQNLSKIILTLSPVLGVNAGALESWKESEIIDYWYSYLESKGIEFKTWKQKAKESGFSDEQLAQYKKAVM